MRKTPRQKRSKEMVSRLIDATGRAIAERGLDHTTTHHIAEAAGVSVGSLYQYFPDKEALIEALLERMGRDIGESFRERARSVDIATLELRPMTAFCIRFGIAMIRNDPLMAEIVRHWTRVPIDRLLDPLEQFFVMLAHPYFVQRYRDYPVQNLDAKLYVLINATLFTAIRHLHQDRPLVRENELVATLTDMIVRLLESPLNTQA